MVKLAVGSGHSTVILDVVELVAPPGPVAVNCTVNVSSSVYTWVGFRSVEVVPSPKDHE